MRRAAGDRAILESPRRTLLTPVKNADEWAEKGGLKDAIWMWPLDIARQAYEALQAQRERSSSRSTRSSGVADIMRGSTDPHETATAQTGKVALGQSAHAPAAVGGAAVRAAI
jgi:hypothetical protein